MDDDFDLPDEGAAEGRSSSFVSDLFGAAKRQAPSANSNRSTFDDILAGAPRRRQPVVTFQDDKEEAAIVPVPSATETAPRAPSGSLLDSLFSSSGAAADQRRKATPATPSRGTSSPSPPTRQILQQSAGSRAPPPSAVPLPSAGGGAIATDAVAAATNAPSSASVTLLQAELDQLRREVSNLRYERSEDQKTVGELRRRLDAALEDHKRTTERLAEQHKLEMNELERRHERALDEAKREGDRAAQILSNVREQEGSFGNLATRMDTLNFTLAQLRESVQSIGGRGEAMEANMNTFAGDLRATLNCQQSEQWKRLETDRQQWENAVKGMESDLDKMREQHTKEIVEGRRWLENQRELVAAERKAFQEEQSLILDWIEHKKTEIEADKNEFLRREHDLLVRVVNERALLEHERREFARQRDADVLRLREEAEQLEQSLAQVESARHALLNARRDLEHKGEQLNELKDALIRSEQRLHWRNRQIKFVTNCLCAPNSNGDPPERPPEMSKLCRFSRFFYAVLLLLTLCSILMADAAVWRMRTDKKAMRNALVRFGKRNAYRSSGEAFVGAAGFGDSGAHLLRDIGMDGRQTQWAAFGDGGAPRPIKRLLLWPEQ